MTNKITIEHNSTAVIDVLQGLMDRLGDLTEPMQRIAGVMEDATERAFATEASPVTGTPWQALSDNYLKANPSRRGGQILQASSGGLAASYTSDYGSDWAEIGSNKIYAAIHHFGGTPEMAPGPAAIPAREQIGLSREDETDILDIVADYLI
ncbi:phage virion morphogenesis protein [Alkalimonas mucilaginosa]|uniref:Phage virion morphogenesis protein n=1 Tax=Alkalimonas mucilaginosa TaxID=3057676 RepID=A0ABU7JH66_9GAMM|nr:phage virion morphogenesis protein [Alkalimonas sp. MEB004]MEE2025037.1 phage virion morphogenesis protein [Alkalimonas sp. MEB004]